MQEIILTEIVAEIKQILLTARVRSMQAVNTELLTAYWNIGRVIVENEQNSFVRADCGKQLLKEVSRQLTRELGSCFSVSNLQYMRRFYQNYQIQQTLSVKLRWSHYCEL